MVSVKGRLALSLVVGLIAGCAALSAPRSIVVSDAELSRRLAERFPVDRRWLEVFDIRLANPQVRTSAQTGLLRIDVDVDLGGRLIERRFAALLRLQAMPRYEERDQSLRIVNVEVDALQVGADGESLLGRAGRLPAALLAQSLEDSVIHRLSTEQVSRIRQQGMQLRSISIADQGGLQLNFEPIAGSPSGMP